MARPGEKPGCLSALPLRIGTAACARGLAEHLQPSSARADLSLGAQLRRRERWPAETRRHPFSWEACECRERRIEAAVTAASPPASPAPMWARPSDCVSAVPLALVNCTALEPSARATAPTQAGSMAQLHAHATLRALHVCAGAMAGRHTACTCWARSTSVGSAESAPKHDRRRRRRRRRRNERPRPVRLRTRRTGRAERRRARRERGRPSRDEAERLAGAVRHKCDEESRRTHLRQDGRRASGGAR